MNAIIVDDEPLAIDLLEDFISRIPFLTLTGKCKNAFEAIQAMNTKQVDLVFLDIQMPGINGIQLLQGIDRKPLVIFTTAYAEYAVESYNLNAVDYLLKPFDFERFFKAVNKAYTLFSNRKSNRAVTEVSKTVEPAGQDFIFVKSDYKTLKINLDDIIYIEGLKDYVKIFTGPKPILTLQSLKSLEEKLPATKFIRVHRSFIVAIQKINSIERGIIRIGDKRIPVGESYREGFQKLIEEKNI
jgi:two-component system, LytTR family, response regulator